MIEKTPSAKDHFLKVGVESNVLFTIVNGIIITGNPLLVLKDIILRYIYTKIWSNGIHVDIVTNGGTS